MIKNRHLFNCINRHEYLELIDIYCKKIHKKSVKDYLKIDNQTYDSWLVCFPKHKIDYFLKLENIPNINILIKLIVDNSLRIESCFEDLKNLIDISSEIIKDKKNITCEKSHMSYLTYQSILLRTKSITSLISNGDLFYESKYIDITSCLPILRCNYESYCNYNNIFIQSKDNEIFNYKFNLWRLSSLNYRQSFPTSSLENKEIKNNESLLIDEIKNIIRTNNLFSSNKEKHIFDKKNYMVDNNGKNINFPIMCNNSGINDGKLFEHHYNHLSMMSHPTYQSVINISDLFIDGKNIGYISQILLLSNAILSFFIRDYSTLHNLKIKNDIVDEYIRIFKTKR